MINGGCSLKLANPIRFFSKIAVPGGNQRMTIHNQTKLPDQLIMAISQLHHSGHLTAF